VGRTGDHVTYERAIMLHGIIDFLNQPIPLFAGMATSLAELVGFVTGAYCVWLVAKENIWTFPIGMVNAAFFFILFLEARLYTDMWLQVFFFLVQIVGWVAWLKAGPNRTELHVARISLPVAAVSAIGVGVFVYLMVPVLREAHGAYPFADSTTTGLSVAAQFLLSFKVLENWLLWIAADLIYIPVYALKGLYFTSALYVAFLIICFVGIRHWWLVYKRNRETLPTAEEVGLTGVQEGARVAV